MSPTFRKLFKKTLWNVERYPTSQFVRKKWKCLKSTLPTCHYHVNSVPVVWKIRNFPGRVVSWLSLSQVKQFPLWFFKEGSFERLPPKTMGIFLSNAAKVSTFLGVWNLHLVFTYFTRSRIGTTFFLQYFFQFCHVIFCAHKFRPLHYRIVSVCIKASTRSKFYVFQNKLECKADFGCVSEMPENVIKFLYEEGVVWWWHGEKNVLYPFFSNSESTMKWLQNLQSF